MGRYSTRSTENSEVPKSAPKVAQPQRVTRSTWEIRRGSSVVPPGCHRLRPQRTRQSRAGRKCLERRMKREAASSQAPQNKKVTGPAWGRRRNITREWGQSGGSFPRQAAQTPASPLFRVRARFAGGRLPRGPQTWRELPAPTGMRSGKTTRLNPPGGCG